MLGSTLFTSCIKSVSEQKQVITIQSIEKATPDLLNESSSIIKQRLTDFGIKDADVSVITSNGTIEITLDSKVDLNEILPLLTAKGKIEFYETYNSADIISLLDKDSNLFNLLNIQQKSSEFGNSTAILGYCQISNRAKVDSYIAINSMCSLNQGVNYLWSKNPDKNGNYYLYVLKQNAALDKSQIKKVMVSNNKNTNSAELQIEFNENGALTWLNLSRNNLDKPIAIVIDNAVYAAPIVRSEIKSGKCQITGDFTLPEIALLKSIIGNKDLPLEFKLVD